MRRSSARRPLHGRAARARARTLTARPLATYVKQDGTRVYYSRADLHALFGDGAAAAGAADGAAEDARGHPCAARAAPGLRCVEAAHRAPAAATGARVARPRGCRGLREAREVLPPRCGQAHTRGSPLLPAPLLSLPSRP